MLNGCWGLRWFILSMLELAVVDADLKFYLNVLWRYCDNDESENKNYLLLLFSSCMTDIN